MEEQNESQTESVEYEAVGLSNEVEETDHGPVKLVSVIIILVVAVLIGCVVVFLTDKEEVVKEAEVLAPAVTEEVTEVEEEKTPFELIIEQRIAENGDPNILTEKEENFLKTLETNEEGATDERAKEIKSIVWQRMIENGDPNIMTEAERAAAAARGYDEDLDPAEGEVEVEVGSEEN
ncbi:hypothetical protein KC851_02720 [Candidatus Kaiserbacteria bacterium]|nr:hypothetical protein [Candidatus Kaiserbacteria bacterium]